MTKEKTLYYSAAALIIGLIMYSTRTPRGIRNNNPGNIRHGDNWQGMAEQQTDPAFVQFESPEYGIRAIARILRTYRDRYQINTVAGIINRWAPPTENNTAAYIAHVSDQLDVKPDEMLDIEQHMPEIIRVIIMHENGQQPYTAQTISEGIAMA